jgi:hypothetical protein
MFSMVVLSRNWYTRISLGLGILANCSFGSLLPTGTTINKNMGMHRMTSVYSWLVLLLPDCRVVFLSVSFHLQVWGILAWILIFLLNIEIKASTCWIFLSFGCLCMIFWSSVVSLVWFGCFRVTLFSVCLSHKFKVQRSVQTYVDISGGDRCEMSAMSISVSRAEWHEICPFRRSPTVELFSIQRYLI